MAATTTGVDHQRGIRLSGPVARPGLDPNATLVARIDLSPTIARFVVRPDGGAGPFEPGQYFALGLTVDGRPLLRPYSTSSAAGSRTELEFLIRLVPAGAFTPRLWALRVGQRLWLGRAKGLFRLRPGDQRTHLFVATGTGLAPFVSMLATLIPNDPAGPSRISLAATASPRALVVHGVSHVEELAYRDRLERLQATEVGLHYVPVVSRPADPANSGWTGLTGRLEAQLSDLCTTHRLDPALSVAYLCGNPAMIATVEGILADHGFAREAVISEQYWPAS